MQNSKKPVILQIIPSLENGGVERGVIDIVKSLKKADFEPIVASNGGILVYQLREAKINHIKLPLHSKNPLTIFLNINRIVKIIAEFRVDIIHVRSRAPMWSAYFACKKTNTKLVSTVHGTYSFNFLKWKIFPPKLFYNAIMLKANRVIAVSNFIKDYLIKNYQEAKNKEKEIVVIHRGADLNYFDIQKVSKSRKIDLSQKWCVPEDKKIILMPARFTAWKGHEFLIETLTKVKNDFFCVMVGSDHGHKKFRKKLEQKIVKANLAEKIRISGICKDMPAAYALSHFVVCPSIKPEAFGRIAIEAQSCSKVIISTNIGGSLETVIEGKTGFLIKAGDVENFANLIDFALEMSQEEADKIGVKARQNIEENFSNQKMCEENIKLYQEILAF
jgi:glycosyltransferase involved in cell wall biosynthesis